MANTTDANQQVTTFGYDGVDRLNLTMLPGGRELRKEFDDLNHRITSKKLQNAGGNYITSRTTFDGLGRTVLDELCENGPSCTVTISTSTEYDALGRKQFVSNPYRSTSDSTYGRTQYEYDPLGRTKKITQPDSSVVTTQYDGNTTTTTDEAGNQRRTTTDALGRLIQVVEPKVTQ